MLLFLLGRQLVFLLFFFFNDPAPTEIYPLPLHDALPIFPDGEFLPPIKCGCSEEIVKRACDKMGIPMIPTRKAVLTVPYDTRPPCHYCGHCMEGCDVGAIFTVPNSMLPKAQRTGNFTLLPSRVAREILTDTDGRAR